MSDQDFVIEANKVFNTVCAYLDDIKWKYEKNEQERIVTMTVTGEDLIIPLTVSVDDGLELIRLKSQLQFTVPKEKMADMSLAVNIVNDSIVNGFFVYDFTNGTIEFKMNSSFSACIMGKEVVEYMINVSCHTIDDYNEKFLFLIKNVISIDDFFRKD